MSTLTSAYRIPFNRPCLLGNELMYIQEAVASGGIAGDASFTKRCHALLEEILGTPRALLTTNCTHALEMTAILLNLGPGDEVILPSFTFVSTANAYALRSVTPVFCDVRPDTLNLDETLLRGLITDRTKAIVVVHYAGVACEMDPIMAIANEAGIPVIEDNAHGLFGRYKSRMLGTIGCMATQSFHETKNLTCGEGGALLINDPAFSERAEVIREKGTNRSRFFRGMVDKYTWVDLGSSYLPSDVLAAYLLAQLEVRDIIQARRAEIWGRYDLELRDWAVANDVQTPYIPRHCDQAFHMYYMLMPDLKVRTAFLAHLKACGILATFHYLPLHLSDMGRKFGGTDGQCPVTERVADQLVRLPMFNDLAADSQLEVIDAVLSFKSA